MGQCPVDVDQWVQHYDHLDGDFAKFPYAVWAAMREQCPIAFSDHYKGFWVPTRYEDIDRIAHDPATFSSAKVAIPQNLFGDDGTEIEFSAPPITSDPPFHTGFRRMLLPAFSPKQIDAWEPITWTIANELIDGFIDEAEFDAAREYSQNIPITVIARMLGVDESMRDTFTSWLRRLVETGPSDPTDAQAAFGEMLAYLWEKILEHREHPQEDIITFLIDTEVDGQRLTDNDLLGSCLLLLLAGIDTTWSSIGSSLHHLATHPGDRRRLVEALDEPAPLLWPMAIEEFLRAFSPVTMARVVVSDVELQGQQLHAGDMLLLPFPAANRDPEVFDRADEVIIDRESNRHYAFGVGIHRCLGSNLARMELRIALQAFLRRIPDFDVVDEELVRYAGGQIRGPRNLPIVVRSGAGVPVAAS
jgi:hypothetical protein